MTDSAMTTTESELALATSPTRREAGARIGRSERSVRRLEQAGVLVARSDANGVVRIDPESLELYVASLAAKGAAAAKSAVAVQSVANGEPAVAPTPPTPAAPASRTPEPTMPACVLDPCDDGELEAEVFALFTAGKTRRQVVIALQLPARVVQAVYRDWALLAGDDLLADDDMREARALLGASVTAKDIVATLKKWAPEVGARRKFTFACSRCGKPVLATPEGVWEAVLEDGLLARQGWHHGSCAE